MSPHDDRRGEPHPGNTFVYNWRGPSIILEEAALARGELPSRASGFAATLLLAARMGGRFPPQEGDDERRPQGR